MNKINILFAVALIVTITPLRVYTVSSRTIPVGVIVSTSSENGVQKKVHVVQAPLIKVKKQK